MNEYDSVQPAYENGPKEVNTKRGLHDGNKQFGKSKLPQDDKPMRTLGMDKNGKAHSRHREYR